MEHPAALLLPLLCGLLYALSAVFQKRAIALGAGAWRMAFATVVATGLVCQLYWLMPPETFAWAMVWRAAAAGLLFATGQGLSVAALSKGDVSVATPILGTKVVLVAVLTVLLTDDVVPWTWWVGALLAAGAVWLLRGHTHVERRRLLPTVLLALGASMSFALLDVLIATWAARWGVNPLLALAFLFSPAGALLMVTQFKPWPRPVATRWRAGPMAALLAAAVLLGLQAGLFSFAIATFGSPTAMNVVFSSRGILAVAIIWMIGASFGLHAEQQQGHAVFARRIIAAGMISLGIALLLI